MKEERLQPQKYKGLSEITMKYYMPRNLKTQVKWTNFQKNIIFQLNEEVESLNRPVIADEIEAVIKKVPPTKSLGLDGFTGKIYKTFKEELTPILHRLFEKTQTDGRLPNSFYEPTSS